MPRGPNGRAPPPPTRAARAAHTPPRRIVTKTRGARFRPGGRAVAVCDGGGRATGRFAPETFAGSFWCALPFFPEATRVLASPHSWTSRGVAGQALLPADENAADLYVLEVATGK